MQHAEPTEGSQDVDHVLWRSRPLFRNDLLGVSNRATVLVVVLMGTACSLLERPLPPLASETLTRADLAVTGAADGYGALELIRPRWLTFREATLAGDTVPAVVFLGQTPQGDVGFLRALRVDEIETIRYIEPARAVARYGRIYAAGIIQVVTRPR